MRKWGLTKKVALALLVVTLANVPMTAWAETVKVTGDVQVEREHPEEEITGYDLKDNENAVVHNGDLNAKEDANLEGNTTYDKIASVVDNSELKVAGDLNRNENNTGSNTVVNVKNNGKLDVDGNVNNIAVKSDNGSVKIGGDVNNSRINADNSNIDISGNVTENNYGVPIYSNGGTKIHVGGDFNTNAGAISIYNGNGDDVIIDGNFTRTSTNYGGPTFYINNKPGKVGKFEVGNINSEASNFGTINNYNIKTGDITFSGNSGGMPTFDIKSDEDTYNEFGSVTVNTNNNSVNTFYSSGTNVHNTVNGDINIKNGAEALFYKGDNTVNGNITVGGDANRLFSEGNNTVNGDITVKGDASQLFSGYTNKDTINKVTGNIVVEGNCENIYIGKELDIGGNFDCSNSQSSSAVFNLGHSNLHIGGDLKTGDGSIFHSSNSPTDIYGDIKIDGDIISKSNEEYYLSVEMAKKFEANNVINDGNGGVYLGSCDTKINNLKSGGGLTSYGKVELNSYYCDYDKSNPGYTDSSPGLSLSNGEINVKEGTYINNHYVGMSIGTNSKATFGDVNIENAEYGLDVNHSDVKTNSLKVKGNVYVSSSNMHSKDIDIDNSDIHIDNSELNVDGDMNTEKGINLGKGNITVGGTLDLGDNSIKAYNAENLENSDLTVWEIKSTDGTIAAVQNYNSLNDEAKQKADEAIDKFESNIKYIVKADAVQNGKITINQTSGNKLYKNVDGSEVNYNTALEDELITVDIIPNDGYEIDSVSGRSAELVKLSDGKYQLKVPRGGGVEISALMKAIQIADVIDDNNSSNNGGGNGNGHNPVLSISLHGESDTPLGYGPEKKPEFYDKGHWVQFEDGLLGYQEGCGRLSDGFHYIRLDNNEYKWFYFGEDHEMKFGWVQSKTDGKWYYLGADGALLRDTVTPDGYKVDHFGARIVEETTVEA